MLAPPANSTNSAQFCDSILQIRLNFAISLLFLNFVRKNRTMISRIIKNSILSDYKRKKVIVLLGARQVGKTTLLSELREGKEKVLLLNCENVDDTLALESKTSTELKQLLLPYDLVFNWLFVK